MTNAVHAPVYESSAIAVPATLDGELNLRFAAARPRLTRIARLNGATADEAEDIAQETLLVAWRSLDHLRVADRFDAWLDGICRNVCRRVARRNAKSRLIAASDADTVTPPLALEAAAADEETPLDVLTRRELVTLIDSALGYLNAASREAISLRYLADLPTEEAANRLGLTVNTLEARLSRARKQLRAALNGPLREQAIEFDLALAPANAEGWRETRMWCVFCGRAHMQGILETLPDGTGRMALRCHQCWRKYGNYVTSVPSSAILGGLKSFRAAQKRLIRHWGPPMQASLTGAAPCYLCGRPTRAQVVSAVDLPAVAREPTDHFYVVATCPHCELHLTAAATVTALSQPDIARFLLERDRVILEPESLETFECAPALRFGLRDLSTNERLIYFADPQSLELRGLASS